jgi:hypothetical protein
LAGGIALELYGRRPIPGGNGFEKESAFSRQPARISRFSGKHLPPSSRSSFRRILLT